MRTLRDEAGVKKAAPLRFLFKTTLFFFCKATGVKADTCSDATHAAAITDTANVNFIVLKERILFLWNAQS